ncbi:MAG: zonular occludens toxin domain-containing protein [Nanoarchaeota archaeon]|nr:zonular occludens toxin domain-containing protein [Nanoarchaeota archaeon]
MSKNNTNGKKEEKYEGILMKLMKLPFRIYKKNKQRTIEKEINEKRESLKAEYISFKIIREDKGSLQKWEEDLFNSDSKIGIVLGARGSGKSAFGLKLLENIYAKKCRKCCAIGFLENEMPSWIEVVENVPQIRNDSIVLIDEGGVLFNSRKSMTSANTILGELMLIARHKNISILFISQNSSNLDINILRQADYLVLKPSSLLQKDFERKKIREIYDSREKDFEKYREEEGLSYIYSDKFQGFITNQLPSFWNTKLSKSFSEK